MSEKGEKPWNSRKFLANQWKIAQKKRRKRRSEAFCNAFWRFFKVLRSRSTRPSTQGTPVALWWTRRDAALVSEPFWEKRFKKWMRMERNAEIIIIIITIRNGIKNRNNGINLTDVWNNSLFLKVFKVRRGVGVAFQNLDGSDEDGAENIGAESFERFSHFEWVFEAFQRVLRDFSSDFSWFSLKNYQRVGTFKEVFIISEGLKGDSEATSSRQRSCGISWRTSRGGLKGLDLKPHLNSNSDSISSNFVSFLSLKCFSWMRSEGFLFLSGGLGAGSCLTRFRGLSAECPRACSLGRGLWALQFSVSRACRRVRVYGRFAWQAWGMGGHRRCRARGFAWQVWGIVHAACVSRGRREERFKRI